VPAVGTGDGSEGSVGGERAGFVESRARCIVVAALLLACSAPEPPAPVWDLMTLVRDDPAQPAERSVRSIGAWREMRTAVVMQVPAAISYPVHVPDGGVLDLAYTVTALFEIVDNLPPVHLRVVLTDETGVEHSLLDRVVDVRAQVPDRRWFDMRIDLAPWTGVTGTLSFRADAEHAPTGALSALALFSAPRISRVRAPTRRACSSSRSTACEPITSTRMAITARRRQRSIACPPKVCASRTPTPALR